MKTNSLMKGMNSYNDYERLVKLTIDAARNQISTRILPVSLLGDIFDSKTLEDCEQYFSLVENHVSVWKSDHFFKTVKNQLLRVCNDLLRRLSRSQNTVFCGRILVFLARFFPLFERSGLNLVGEFNKDNMITISPQDELQSVPELEVKTETDLEEGETSEATSESTTQVDYNLYVKFWKLQEFFRRPMQCYEKDQWEEFHSNTSSVLSAFTNMKLEPSALKNVGQNSEKVYFAKYLTNQKLLELQLSDSNFRRYILIQFLILFRYLTADVKFKSESQVLTSEQTEIIQELTNKVLDLIAHTPPDGPFMRTIIKQIMEREENWSNWKNDGCIEVKPSTSEIKINALNRKRKVGEEIMQAEDSGQFSLGNKQLTQLWNQCPDNWEACRSQKRVFTPSVEDFFDDILHASPMNKAATINCDDHFKWRALRLLCQKSNHFFTPSNQMVKPLSGYFESVLDKLSKDLQVEAKKETPGNTPVDDAEDISDDELLRDKCTTEEQDVTARTPHLSEGESVNGDEPDIKSVIEQLAQRISNRWKQLASTLKFSIDEIEFFESESLDASAAALRMLNCWSEQEEPENVNASYLQKAIDTSNIDVKL